MTTIFDAYMQTVKRWRRFFSPMDWLDRRIRPHVWEPSPMISILLSGVAAYLFLVAAAVAAEEQHARQVRQHNAHEPPGTPLPPDVSSVE